MYVLQPLGGVDVVYRAKYSDGDDVHPCSSPSSASLCLTNQMANLALEEKACQLKITPVVLDQLISTLTFIWRSWIMLNRRLIVRGVLMPPILTEPNLVSA